VKKPHLLLLAVWCAAACLGASVGCAHGPIRDENLILDIQPVPLVRGQRALVTINAPLDAVEVVGRVKVMGSPEAVFMRENKKKFWYFSGKIPFSPWVTPGQYTLRVVVTLPEGKRIYNEAPVDLR